MEDKFYFHKSGIPQWMLGNETELEAKTGRINAGFLRKTLIGISKVIQNDIASERLALKKGLLQSIDPRVKLASMLLFMIFAGVTGSMTVLSFLIILAVMFVKLSSLDISVYIKRVWLIIPLILFVVSIPAATNLLINGKPLIYIYRGRIDYLGLFKLPQGLYFSDMGLKSVLKLSVRVGVSFSFGYILVMTTHWTQLTKALGALRVPKLIITVLDMTYRYILALSKLSVEIFEARFLRTVGKIRNSDNRNFIANSVAFLFAKSSYMSDEIYNSMVCRGYTGEPVCMNEFKFSRNDFIWILNMIIFTIVLVMGELIFG